MVKNIWTYRANYSAKGHVYIFRADAQSREALEKAIDETARRTDLPEFDLSDARVVKSMLTL